MKLNALMWFLAAAAGCGAQAPMAVKHVFTGADGMSHVGTAELPMTRGSGALALADTAGPERARTAFITRLAAGYTQDWTRAPSKRWVTVVSGRAEIAGADGMLAVGPGDVILVEDVTGRGHRFRVVGDTPWVAVVVNLE